jgi:hypothetical protein
MKRAGFYTARVIGDRWRGSGATFEIVPVVSSKETREVVAPYLDKV